jgi:hypothetical protein
MPSFFEQLKSLPLLFGGQRRRARTSQVQAEALKERVAQLPGGGEQIDISESETITPTGPVVPAVLGTPAAVAPQPGVAPTPAAPTVGMAEGVPTVPGEAEAAPPLGGITPEALTQFRELMGQKQTPEMLEQKRKSQELLKQLIPFRQQLAQAEAPTEAMIQLDAQIAGLERQIEQATPEAFESTLGRTKGFAAAMAAKQRAPVRAEIGELLFKRSIMGQKRTAEAQRAQAGITAIGAEFDIRQAMAQLGRPAELPAGIQTELFKRAFPTAPEPTLRTVGNQLLELIPGQAPKILYSAPVGQDPFTTQQKLTNIRNAKKDFEGLQEVKDFKEIDARMDILLEAQKEAQTTGNFIAVDQAIITTFNKITDPDSVVRESEYARTQSDQSLLNRLKGTVKAWAAGGPGLTQDDRDAIVRLAGLFREVAAKKYRNARKSAQSELKRFDLPTDVIPDVEIKESIEVIERGGGSFRRNEDGSYTRVK